MVGICFLNQSCSNATPTLHDIQSPWALDLEALGWNPKSTFYLLSILREDTCFSEPVSLLVRKKVSWPLPELIMSLQQDLVWVQFIILALSMEQAMLAWATWSCPSSKWVFWQSRQLGSTLSYYIPKWQNILPLRLQRILAPAKTLSTEDSIMDTNYIQIYIIWVQKVCLHFQYTVKYGIAYISPGEGNGNPLQYSCLENSMDGRPW